MGDIADMMLDGDMCQGCGEVMDGDGYPKFCRSCQDSQNIDAYGDPIKQPKPPAKKVNCPVCRKKVKEAGLSMHMKDVHNK